MVAMALSCFGQFMIVWFKVTPGFRRVNYLCSDDLASLEANFSLLNRGDDDPNSLFAVYFCNLFLARSR